MKRYLICLFPLLILVFAQIPTSAAQENPNPTPIIIDLSPPSPTPGSGPATPLPGTPFPDRFEANDTMETARQIGFQVEAGLTLTAGDVDFFSGYLKRGQWLAAQTAVYDSLDTELTLFWAGMPLVANDDRSGVDLGSQVTFQAPADGWYILQVRSVAGSTGSYDLLTTLIAPTATATPWPTGTPLPTVTPLPTATPWPTATPAVLPDIAEPNDMRERAYGIAPDMVYSLTMGQGDIDYFTFMGKAGSAYACETITPHIDTLLNILVGAALAASNDDRGPQRVDSYVTWQMETEQAVVVEVQSRSGATGSYDLRCAHHVAAPLAPVGAAAMTVITETGLITETAVMTSTTMIGAGLPAGAVPLAIRPLGPEIPPEPVVQAMQLVVYYDSNNDQKPSPGEGVPHVSVLAVNANGQYLARVFTNAGGEAVFNTTDKRIDRLVVPFVSDWSVKVQPGRPESLGLPAVRLPVFLPVGFEDSAR